MEYEKIVDHIEKMMKETAKEMRGKERFSNEAIVVRLEENNNKIQLLKSTIEDKNRIISILEKALINWEVKIISKFVGFPFCLRV